MVTTDVMRKIALSLPDVVEEPHFEKASFRVAKKIFATLTVDGSTAMIKLSKKEQEIFCTGCVIYPVPNKWGQNGATYIDLNKIEENLLTEMLKCAYKGVAPTKLSSLVVFNSDN